jgi:hypothetical protein
VLGPRQDDSVVAEHAGIVRNSKRPTGRSRSARSGALLGESIPTPRIWKRTTLPIRRYFGAYRCYMQSAGNTSVASGVQSLGGSDVDRRTLSPDDAQAACDIYPGTRSACDAPSPSQGCSMLQTANQGSIGFLATLAVLLFATLAARRLRGSPTC